MNSEASIFGRGNACFLSFGESTAVHVTCFRAAGHVLTWIYEAGARMTFRRFWMMVDSMIVTNRAVKRTHTRDSARCSSNNSSLGLFSQNTVAATRHYPESERLGHVLVLCTRTPSRAMRLRHALFTASMPSQEHLVPAAALSFWYRSCDSVGQN
jgi:hypothetical protein